MPILRSVRNALALLLWGSGILWLALTARLQSYLHPSLQPFTIVGGVLLLLLAGFSIRGLAAMRNEIRHTCSCDHVNQHHPDKLSRLGFLPGMIIMILPVIVALSGNADRFTAMTVTNKGVVQDLSKLPSAAANAAATAVKPLVSTNVTESIPGKPVGPMPLQVIDMLYALQMPSYREEFEGKEVEMIAQYVPMTTDNPKGDRFQAIRMFMTCCAADAKPMGVTVHSEQIPKVPEMQWVKITGRATFPMKGGKRSAILEACKVESCNAPSDPFVY